MPPEPPPPPVWVDSLGFDTDDDVFRWRIGIELFEGFDAISGLDVNGFFPNPGPDDGEICECGLGLPTRFPDSATVASVNFEIWNSGDGTDPKGYDRDVAGFEADNWVVDEGVKGTLEGLPGQDQDEFDWIGFISTGELFFVEGTVPGVDNALDSDELFKVVFTIESPTSPPLGGATFGAGFGSAGGIDGSEPTHPMVDLVRASTVVPLPATAPLLLTVMGALVGAGLLRRKAAA